MGSGVVMNLFFYTRYAVRSLLRGGQRTVLAVICIAFGVMSLVAMQSLASLFDNALVSNPRNRIGADLGLQTDDNNLSTERLAQLEQHKQAGDLARYTLIAQSDSTILKPANTGHVYALNQVLGIDPATYPLNGSLDLRDTSVSLASVLAEPRSAIITRDVADRLGLKVGDTFTLSSLQGNAPAELHITAIATMTPGHTGNTVFCSLDTLRQISGNPNGVTFALALNGKNGNAAAILNREGWSVLDAATLDTNTSQSLSLFDFMFKGAGILGLIIGGIGVANTLQVLLARRKTEIAVLKTFGYLDRDLLALFGIELALLGIAGAAIGAVAALLFTNWLIGFLLGALSILITWSVDPLLLTGGVLAGIASTLVFGSYAVVRASGIRPSILLRDLPALRSWRGIGGTLALFALLVAVFVGVCTLVMGSLVQGLGVVVGAIVGFVALSIAFGVILFVFTHLPLPKIGVLRMARSNLKRQQFRAVSTLIALFAGVFTIAFAAMIISNASDRFGGHSISTGGNNLMIIAHPADLALISTQLTANGLKPTQIRYELPVQITSGTATAASTLRTLDRLAADLHLAGASWDSTRIGVYVPADTASRIGESIQVQLPDGTKHDLEILGTYVLPANDTSIDQIQRFTGLLMNKQAFDSLESTASSLTVISSIPTDQLSNVTEALGSSLPSTTVISLADVNEVIQRNFKNLFTLAVAVAGLALVAGAVLIANSVGLAMVERKREMGILKAIGYNSRQILATIMLEQGLLGLLGGIVGIVAVGLAILLVNATQSGAQMIFKTPEAVIMIGVALLIALGSAGLVAWQPTHVRPLEVLRNE